MVSTVPKAHNQAMVVSVTTGGNSLDLPVPFRPTRAYRWLAFSRSLALFRISIPSPLDFLALPLAPDPPPEVTVILRPSTSSYGSIVSRSHLDKRVGGLQIEV
jgi:hypothetical protein